MNRRSLLTALAVVAVVIFVRPAAAPLQDVEYERALERAQRDRPRVLTTSARIAPVSEPGTPLVIHGSIFQRDGRIPAPGLVVFAYHTDATGRYDVASAGPHSWRLRGWAKAGAEGEFEFTTIRPAEYPSRKEPAHVHLSIAGPGVPRQSAGLLFAGDPLITEKDRDESAKAGLFGFVRPIEVRDGVQHVTLNIKIR